MRNPLDGIYNDTDTILTETNKFIEENWNKKLVDVYAIKHLKMCLTEQCVKWQAVEIGNESNIDYYKMPDNKVIAIDWRYQMIGTIDLNTTVFPPSCDWVKNLLRK